MKRRKNWPARIIVLAGVFLMGCVFSAPAALGADPEGRWGIGVRVGPSMLTHDIAEDVKGDIGPLVSGQIFARIDERRIVGLNVEWELHSAEVAGIEIGEAEAVSLLVFTEFRSATATTFIPYFLLGLGLNLNSFSPNNTFQQACSFAFGSRCEVEPDTTLAFKIGGGFDYLVTPHLRFNVELGLKINSGEQEIIAGSAIGTDDYRASAVSPLVGFRWL